MVQNHEQIFFEDEPKSVLEKIKEPNAFWFQKKKKPHMDSLLSNSSIIVHRCNTEMRQEQLKPTNIVQAECINLWGFSVKWVLDGAHRPKKRILGPKLPCAPRIRAAWAPLKSVWISIALQNSLNRARPERKGLMSSVFKFACLPERQLGV